MNLQEITSKLPQTEADFDPCFAFSVHKCGSTMMHTMINSVCRETGIPGISLPDTFFNMGLFEKDWQSDETLLPVFERKLLYYGFRNLPQILLAPQFDLRSKRFVLLVRDPRDALVSQYFSFGRKKSSHRLPKNNAEAFIKRVEEQPELSIDDYVVQAANNLRIKLEVYRDSLNFDLGLTRRYEDVFFDKETFLGEIFGHFGIGVPADVIARVARDNDIRPEKEDDTKHIRKGMPGDHAEKLQPATIARLNDTFREVGAFYGYDL